MRYHPTWSEQPSSKNSQTINPGEGVEKREPSYTVGEWIQALWRTVQRSLKKNKNRMNHLVSSYGPFEGSDI